MAQIKDIETLLGSFVGHDRSIFKTNVTNLTVPGENYMSDIVKLHVILKNNNTGVTEDYRFAVKLAIINKIVGSTAILFQKEILFYTKILPALESFKEKHGVVLPDCFPKHIASRMNLNGSEIADEDAVIVLEDLTEQGYSNVDRHVGFDLNGAKLVLKDIANFHAVPLAMRLLEPETYDIVIVKNSQNLFPQFKKNDGDKQGPDFMRFLIELFKNNEKYSDIVPAFMNFMNNVKEIMEDDPLKFFNYKPDTQFETLTHQDLWSNNTMQINQDGKPIKNKLVDFQAIRSNTIVNDLILFLVSSVQQKYLEENFDELIEFYYQNFSDTLKKFGCMSTEYSYEKFLEALPKECQMGLIQCTFMIAMVIFSPKGKEADPTVFRSEDVPLIAKEKIGFLYKEAVKRGWLT